jgi:hypothetical protein
MRQLKRNTRGNGVLGQKKETHNQTPVLKACFMTKAP